MLKDFEQSQVPFESQKRDYFFSLGLKVRRALSLHKDVGLWNRVYTDGKLVNKRDWGNVSEHCLVEVARIATLAEMLDFSEQTTRELEISATLHDFNKRYEKESMVAAVKSGQSVWNAYEQSSEY